MNQYSTNLFSETEKSKQLFNLDTHQIIFDRYHLLQLLNLLIQLDTL